LQFLSKTLGLQLVVAMPTSKSGAVKPEFDKEFTFSKVLASREGTDLFVSEVQEKTLQREPMARLWSEHAARARESGRLAHQVLNPGSTERLVAAGVAAADAVAATDAAGAVVDDPA
jgi:hypothetical protein